MISNQGGGGAGGIIKFKTCLRNTILDVMKLKGWKEADENEEWDFFWADVHWIFENFKFTTFLPHQKINHFWNHYELTRKDLLIKNVKRTQKYLEKEHGRSYSEEYDFIPTSFSLPQEYALFKIEYRKNPKLLWIVKPVGRCQGKGIFLLERFSQLNILLKKERTSDINNNINTDPSTTTPSTTTSPQIPEGYIVQKYIENPYLVGGKKFDIRIYVLVTSYSPLTVYLHRLGFCRFSSVQYSKEKEDFTNMVIHATNVAIQKGATEYDSENGCKWQLRNLRMYLTSKHGKDQSDKAFTDIEAVIVKSLLSVQKIIIHDKHCFELYGYDVLLDENLKPWLLEINASPSLSVENHLDYESKCMVLGDMLSVLDMEKTSKKQTESKVGGFDLIYNSGAAKHKGTNIYVSHLGGYVEWKKLPVRVRKMRKSTKYVE